MKTVEFDIVDDNLVENTEEFKVAVVYSSVPAVTWENPIPVNILDNDGIYVFIAVLIISNWSGYKADLEVTADHRSMIGKKLFLIRIEDWILSS